jgi:hypothetical protein
MTVPRPRYADTSVCPDCRSTLPPAPFRCPTCALPLQGFLASQLLRTLQEADDLLDRLRASALAPATRLDPDLPPMPAARPAPVRTGLQGASVPKILLGLGATCLLVAAVIFLAVAWTWLGVGGRTAVLVALTATTGTAGVQLGRRGLTVAAEALTTVAFGLVVLDVVGADHAGWFGDLSETGLLRLVGAGLLLPGLALSLRPGRLVVPQLSAPAGAALLLATVDWSAVRLSEVDLAGPLSVVTLAALCGLGRRLGADVLAWGAGALAGASWVGAGLWSLTEASTHPSGHDLWVIGHGWELVVMSLLSLLLWAVAWDEPLVRQGCAVLVVSTLTYVVVLPGLDGTPDRLALLAIGITLAWALVAAATPPAWSAVPRVPLAAGAAGVATVVLALLTYAGTAVASVGAPVSVSAAVRLVPVPQPLHPAVLVLASATLAVAGIVAIPRSRRSLPLAGIGVAACAFATLGLVATPLWVVLAGPAVVATGLLAVALRREDARAVGLAGAAAALATFVGVAALPSLVLLTVTLAATVAGLVATLALGRFELAREAAGLGLPATTGALIWAVAELTDLDPALRAAPVLILLGLLALVLARPEVEISAAVTGLVAAVVAVPVADDVSVSLAVHLTLAGVLVTGSSILHPERRVLAWPGGLLLASATWVRLADLGVEAPEAYTLPSALVLVLAGLQRIHAADDAATAPTLGPGLALATVPSLLWVLADPVTPRAVLLGLGCLALLLAGASLRWHAPVVVGALVDGAVVLRELAPYALQTPQWVVIGAAGTVLIGCGITWESRMRDLQHAAAYLGRLR